MVRRLAVLLAVLAAASLAGCTGPDTTEENESQFCPVDDPGSPEGVPEPDQVPDPGRGLTQVFPRPTSEGSASMALGRWVVAGADKAVVETTGLSGGLEGAAVSLWTPDGRELTITDELPSGTSSGEPGPDTLYRASIGGGYGDRLFVGVREPADGVWTLQLENPSEEREVGPVISQLHVEGQPNVEPLWEGPATVGDPFRFQIAVEDEDRSVRGAEVYGRVYDAGEDRMVDLTFQDDGKSPDRDGGDGVYTAQRTFSEPGEPRLWVEACKDGWVRSIDPGFIIVREGN